MVQFVHRALIKPGGKRVVQNSFLQRTWVRVGRKDKEAPAIINHVNEGSLATDSRFQLWEDYAPKYQRMLGLRCTQAAWNIMKRLLSERDNGIVLDGGCGNGEMLEVLVRKSHGTQVIGADFSPSFLLEAQKRIAGSLSEYQHRISLWKVDLSKPLPWSNNTFDLCVLNFVIQYLSGQEQPRTLAEICRVMKKGGVLFLSTFVEGADFGSVVRRNIPKELVTNPLALIKGLTIVPITRRFDAFRQIGKMYNPTLEELNSWHIGAGFSHFQVLDYIFDGVGVITKAMK